jgi:hypothetical protein
LLSLPGQPATIKKKHFRPAKYNRRHKIISYPKSVEYAPSMYYLGQEKVTVSPKSLEHFDASYFVEDVEGVTFHLEEEHFGFLK